MDIIYASHVGGSDLQKIVFVSPDGFSIVNIFHELIKIINFEKEWEIVAICSTDKYIPIIKELGVRHIPVEMDRYITPIKDLQYLYVLLKIFRKEKFDVIINFTLKPIVYGAIAARIAHNNLIISAFRGLGRVFYSEVNLKERLLKYFVTQLLWIACVLSRLVWFTNKSDYLLFLSKGILKKDKIILTKNGVNIIRFSKDSVDISKLNTLKKSLDIKEDNKIIIMVARLLWPKGIKEFVEAAKIITAKYKFAKFIIVGPLEVDTPQYVPESYLKDNERLGYINWLGFRDDVRDLYAISDIAVLPSYYKEGGYPRALLEPMALGKPVITTETPDCRGPVEDGKNGYLIPIKDPIALASAIENLINDSAKIKEFGLYSREKVEKEFDEKAILTEVFSEIKNITKNQKVR